MMQAAATRVLLVRLGSLGDIVHGLPALATLKHSFPAWEIDWLVERRWKALLDDNPYLTRVVTVDTLAWRAAPLSGRTWRALGDVIRAMRERHYDYAVDLQGAVKSALACRASQSSVVIGFDGAWLREREAGLFYTRRVRPQAVHVVDANLELVQALGARELTLEAPLPSGDEREVPRELLREPMAVINPGAGWPSKRWTVEGYAQLCDSLYRDHALRVVLNYGPAEEGFVDQVQRVCRGTQPMKYGGTIPGLIALLRRARIMIAPDTGPLHLAAALGVPTVGLFGPTDPQRNGPYGGRSQVLREPDAFTSYRHRDGRGMERIQAEKVIAAVADLLGTERHNKVTAAPRAPATQSKAAASEASMETGIHAAESF